MPRRKPVPSYRLHKPTGQGVVTISGPNGSRKDVYLGPYNSSTSLAEYRRIIAHLAADQDPTASPPPAGGPTVAELLLGFLRWAKATYRTPDGKPTGTYDGIARGLRKLKELYAHTLVAEFGPKDLVAVRTAMVGEGVSRKIVNSRVQVIKKVFRWGVAEDLVPPLVHTKLAAVEGLRAGRTTAPDHPPVRPAVAADVEAAIPHMPPAVAAIVRLQRMAGARCGELCSLRTVDIDRTNPAMWTFAPTGHKGTWRGKSRTIYFGKRCQELLGPVDDLYPCCE